MIDWFSWAHSIVSASGAKRAGQGRGHAQPRLERLEDRTVPYSVTGNAWAHPELITISFVPDGTPLTSSGGTTITSNLFSTFNAKFGSAAAWQNQILKAAQAWAQQTNINFAVVPDSGASAGSGDYQQGDPGFGDIRIGGYNFNSATLASAFMPPPVNNYSIAGDLRFNTGQTFNVGSTYDLFTVAVHEFGHVLGLGHSSASTAVMYSAYNGVDSALNADDTSGIRAIYSGGSARAADRYDAAASNGASSSATNLTSQLDATTRAALIDGLNISSVSDIDWYKFVAPAGSSTMTVKVQSTGRSLLAPLVSLYNSSQTQVATGKTTGYQGGAVTLSVSVTPGQTYYVKVDGADATAFGTGAYALAVNFGSGGLPEVPGLDTSEANGSVLSGGGGIATRVDDEALVNQTTSGTQQTDPAGARSIAMDASGNYAVVWTGTEQGSTATDVFVRLFDASGAPRTNEVLVNSTTAGSQQDATVAMSANGDFVVTWSSSGQDNGTWGVYAQRFGRNGNKVGGEFRVNTTSAGDQRNPTAAMNASGNFVIAWQSSGQDGSGSGIYAQRFSASGNPLGGETRVNTYTTGDQSAPSVAMNSTGAYVVAWTSAGQDGSGSGIYAQRFSASGAAVGNEFRVNTTTSRNQASPSVALSDSGAFVVAWSSEGQDGSDYGIFAQRFGSDGAAAGAEFAVNSYKSLAQNNPCLAMDGVGNFVISWSSNGQDGSGWGVYAQQFTRDGMPVEGEFRVATTSALNQQFSGVAMSGSGHMVIDWSGNGAQDGGGVYAQRYLLNLPSPLGGGEQHGFDPSGHCTCHCRACRGAAQLGAAPEAAPDADSAPGFRLDDTARPAETPAPGGGARPVAAALEGGPAGGARASGNWSPFRPRTDNGKRATSPAPDEEGGPFCGLDADR